MGLSAPLVPDLWVGGRVTRVASPGIGGALCQGRESLVAITLIAPLLRQIALPEPTATAQPTLLINFPR